MSLKKKVLISFAAVIALLAIFLFIATRNMYTPTRGEKIAAYAQPQKALLVIDVQEDYTGLKGKQPMLFKEPEKEIAAINRLIDHASRSGMQVVYIRQVFDDNAVMRTLIGRTIEGQPGAALDARITVVNSNDFTKRISDAFSNSSLDEFLIRNQVDELYLTGLDAASCVHKTALGGLNRGYKVTVVKDAVLTQKNMADILKRYEKDGILTASSEEILRSRGERP